MHQMLRCHPESLSGAAIQVTAEAVPSGAGRLTLIYAVSGDIESVRFPPRGPAVRRDGLWRHTCFEAFVRADAEGAYYEFNLSPSSEWAAYRFDRYREGMRNAAEIFALPIEVASHPDRCTLQAILDLGRLADLSRRTEWRLGLSAVIEDTGEARSYWALAHPPGKPDFHHPDCFAQRIVPA